MTALFADALDTYEREIEAECVPLDIGGPFKAGERIVLAHNPATGSLTVNRCTWTYGHWRVEAHGGGTWTSAPADEFVRVPPGWREPPPWPASALFALECSTDGAITRGEYAAARRTDAAQAREFAEYSRALADWWDAVGRLVDPAMADDEASGLRWLAATIEGEEVK